MYPNKSKNFHRGGNPSSWWCANLGWWTYAPLQYTAAQFCRMLDWGRLIISDTTRRQYDMQRNHSKEYHRSVSLHQGSQSFLTQKRQYMYYQSKWWDWQLKNYEIQILSWTECHETKTSLRTFTEVLTFIGVHIQGDEHMHRFSKMQPTSVGCVIVKVILSDTDKEMYA